MKTTEAPITIKHLFAVSAERLWKAITVPEQMREWFFGQLEDFKPEVGFKTQFDVQSETRLFPHVWEIVEVIPFKRIVYTWKYQGYKGEALVGFELKENGSETTLILTITILEDFQDNIPEFKRESCSDGWTYFIKNQLYDYLQNK